MISDPMQAYVAPKKIPRGKMSLSQALIIMSKHEKSPMEYGVQSIVKEFNLEESHVKQFLRYFKEFKLEELEEKEFKEVEETKMTFAEREANFRKMENEIIRMRQYSENPTDDSTEDDRHSFSPFNKNDGR